MGAKPTHRIEQWRIADIFLEKSGEDFLKLYHQIGNLPCSLYTGVSSLFCQISQISCP